MMVEVSMEKIIVFQMLKNILLIIFLIRETTIAFTLLSLARLSAMSIACKQVVNNHMLSIFAARCVVR